ncbi:Responsible for the deiodination of T4 (3,5,3',5'- tetraiodothyronine) [Halocaridina rubra]|uniref:Iodothyronine deiodinase n=1 Tax=Halocaridina rubra TaxID=373956 RepID=A0AAN9ADP0_HALRR
MEERIQAAKKMVDIHPLECDVLVDMMDDEANIGYAAMPERLYIVKEGVVVYKGGLGPFDYKAGCTSCHHGTEDWAAISRDEHYRLQYGQAPVYAENTMKIEEPALYSPLWAKTRNFIEYRYTLSFN